MITGDEMTDEAELIARELARDLVGKVDFSISARALYASDASNYRIVPLGVVFVQNDDDVLATLVVARRHGVSIVSRGGGTSTGGQTVGPGIVIDYSRHLDEVLDLDPVARTARVQPGVVLDTLQRRALVHGLRFGPDPSTHDRCTIGGMIGNNACGAHSMRWGKTDENVLGLRVVTYRGETIELSTLDALSRDSSPFGQELARGCQALVARYGEAIRTQMGPPMPRRVSGYGLGHLLPENGGHLARALVGTEGTCVAILDATVRLAAPPRARVLLVLGFGDLYLAADAVPELLAHAPLTIEGLDARLVELARSTNESGAATRLLPAGNGWLLVEIGAEDLSEANDRARELIRALEGSSHPPSSSIAVDETEQRAIWRLREDGAGLATRLPDGSEAWPGWEDAAVPPEHLGDYLRKFDALLARHHRQGVHYGHFGEGCMHIRIDFDFLSEKGRADFRHFIEDAADLVVSFGGSLSGEHGDGQARTELLGKMYPPVIIEAFREFKALFDPDAMMNPGRIEAPRRLDEDLRIRPPVRAIDRRSHLALSVDHGDLERSARRCVGVGKCRRLDGGAMCPSFQVTRDERDSTRGRARLLSEMFSGDLIENGWRSKEVREALDLCLSCKACASDCPVGVDMASYKAEFLSHHYKGRIRPLSHYSLGNLPLVARRLRRVLPLVNVALSRPFAPLTKRLGGIDGHRELPRFACRSFQDDHRNSATEGTVIMFPDTFTNYFSPVVATAALEVLEALGAQVIVPRAPMCCGLTWYSTGQIDRARKVLRRTVSTLVSMGGEDLPIVVLEPSCASMLRDELVEVLADDADAKWVAGRIVSLATMVQELSRENEEDLFVPTGARYLAQVHCHQYATTGYAAEVELLERIGASRVELETGCCGLAGNFGFEKGHYGLSREIANRSILSRLSTEEERTGTEGPLEIVADGFSCRTQIAELSRARPRHLAQILRDALRPAP